MKYSHFFRISWLVQLIVGISLFSVSFLIENQVLQAFIATPILALLLAASLELGKAAAIIWHRYMTYHKSMGYPNSVKLASSAFRVGLLILSMLCSLLFLSNNLDRPHLEEVRKTEISRSEQRLDDTLLRMEQQIKQRLERLTQRQKAEYDKLKLGFDIRINKLEGGLNKEMDNVVNRNFKGPRYVEIQSRLKAEKSAQIKELEKLAKKHKQAYQAETDYLEAEQETKRELAYTKADTSRDELISNDFSTDERANDSRIISFLKVFQSVFNAEILPLQFVFMFSLLISLLVEVGILLAFDTVTLSILPALQATHKADLSEDILKTEINSETKEDQIRHEEALNKIRNTADNVMHKAREYMSAQDDSDHK